MNFIVCKLYLNKSNIKTHNGWLGRNILLYINIYDIYPKIIVSLDNGIMSDTYLLPYAFIYFPTFLLL